MASSKRTAAVLCLASLLSCTSKPSPSQAPSPSGHAGRPNILVIVTDDQRTSGTLSSMPRTVSWLKDQGTFFPHAFATTPLCCPSRSALLTGMYAHNTGIKSNSEDPAALAAVQDLTIEHVLHDAGYSTAIFGKYFNGWPNTMDPAYFDRWAVTPLVTYSGADWNVGDAAGGGSIQTVSTYATSFIRDQALAYLDSTSSNPAQPWFLYAAPMAPHRPSTPDAEFAQAAVAPLPMDAARRETDRTDKPPYIQARPLLHPSKIERDHSRQLRTLMSVDLMVDALMTKVSELGELDNTIVVFCSDNGIMWGEHGLSDKSVPYVESVGVPLLIRWTGHVAAGAVDRRVVGLLDIAPTLFDATGLTPTHPIDGSDLLDPSTRRAELLLEYWRIPGVATPSWTALIGRRYEFVQYGADGGHFREYYDLRTDPAELSNLLANQAPAHPPIAGLEVRLRRFSTCVGVSCPR